MIDIENLVIDNVSTALTTAIDGIFVTSEPTESPASFPAALLYEEDNSTYTKALIWVWGKTTQQVPLQGRSVQ